MVNIDLTYDVSEANKKHEMKEAYKKAYLKKSTLDKASDVVDPLSAALSMATIFSGDMPFLPPSPASQIKKPQSHSLKESGEHKEVLELQFKDAAEKNKFFEDNKDFLPSAFTRRDEESQQVQQDPTMPVRKNAIKNTTETTETKEAVSASVSEAFEKARLQSTAESEAPRDINKVSEMYKAQFHKEPERISPNKVRLNFSKEAERAVFFETLRDKEVAFTARDNMGKVVCFSDGKALHYKTDAGFDEALKAYETARNEAKHDDEGNQEKQQPGL